jgi:nitronate monooxygenase
MVECAGHPGESTFWPGPTPGQEEVGIPVIASGGIADARGLVAALALGCEGVNMGSRFLATKEAPIHDSIKQQILQADENATKLIFRPLRNTLRIFDNSVARHILEMEAAGKGIDEIGPVASGQKGRIVFEQGSREAGVWAAGISIGLVHDVPTVEELISRMVREASAIINERLPRMTV